MKRAANAAAELRRRQTFDRIALWTAEDGPYYATEADEAAVLAVCCSSCGASVGQFCSTGTTLAHIPRFDSPIAEVRS